MKRHPLLMGVLTILVACGVIASPADAGSERSNRTHVHHREVIVIGHRGASGYRPEHTLGAYELAIRQCADFIEPDVVSTRDGALVVRHENEISTTTDVDSHPEFASRRTTKTIDGLTMTGWFTEDFTLAELKTLRAKERIPSIRPQNTAYDGVFAVPTLKEVLALARRSRTCAGTAVGVYPETKHPSYFRSIGLGLEERLVDELHANGYRGRHAPVFIQSFEVNNLRLLNELTRLRLVQLIGCDGQPPDFAVGGDPRTYADLVTPAGLDFVRTYADGIGVCKDVLIPLLDGTLGEPSSVAADAHRRGLLVHAWTLRAENLFLPVDLRSSADPNAPGDVAAEARAFVRAGADGLFSDNPDIVARAVHQRAVLSDHDGVRGRRHLPACSRRKS
jgi:glycerophosphoryl diester phosphodiesterase